MPEVRRDQPQESRNSRVARHWGTLAADLRTWVDLKISLIEIELTDRVKQELLEHGLPGLLYGAAAAMLLIAIALGLGTVLGHPAWGFAVTGGMMGAAAALVHLRHIRAEKARIHGKRQPETHRLGSAADAEGEDPADRAAPARTQGGGVRLHAVNSRNHQ